METTTMADRRGTAGRTVRMLAVMGLLGSGGCAGGAAAPVPGAGAESDRRVAELEAVWAGNDNQTPAGPMPFALVFDREPDGGLHAHTAAGPNMYLDLRVHRDERGRWLLTEEGSFPGAGVQRHTLEPTTFAAGVMEWEEPQQPGLVRVRIELAAGALKLSAFVRGKPHAVFNLTRLEGEAAERVRRSLQPPGAAAAVP